MNALRPGQLGLILGTSSCHMAIATDPIFGSGSWGPYPDALAAGTWILEGGQTASGSIVRWIEQTCGNGRDIAALDAAADAVGPGAQGLLALDYWQGNRSPRQDPLGRGVFVGLTLSHEVGHMLRAVYEATAYGTRHIVEDMVAHGFAPREVVACGGGTRSRLWLQLHADICQLPIVLTTQPESTALGAAMCAAVGAGAFGSLTEAGDAMVQMQERIEPSAGAKDVYDRRYAQYLAAYERLQPLMHQLAAEQSDVG
jgi:ribulose kinase